MSNITIKQNSNNKVVANTNMSDIAYPEMRHTYEIEYNNNNMNYLKDENIPITRLSRVGDQTTEKKCGPGSTIAITVLSIIMSTIIVGVALAFINNRRQIDTCSDLYIREINMNKIPELSKSIDNIIKDNINFIWSQIDWNTEYQIAQSMLLLMPISIANQTDVLNNMDEFINDRRLDGFSWCLSGKDQECLPLRKAKHLRKFLAKMPLEKRIAFRQEILELHMQTHHELKNLRNKSNTVKLEKIVEKMKAAMNIVTSDHEQVLDEYTKNGMFNQNKTETHRIAYKSLKDLEKQLNLRAN